MDLDNFNWNSEYGTLVALGRLKPGYSIKEAEAQVNAIEAQILHIPAYEGDRRAGSLTALVQPMQEAIVGTASTGLWLLMAAVLSLMLIACLNLANTQLGRALARHRESAIRAALGASKCGWSGTRSPKVCSWRWRERSQACFLLRRH